MAGVETRRGFVPNHVEFGRHIRSEIAARPSLIIAGKIATAANALAPFQPERDQPGYKKDRRRKHLKGTYRARRAGNLRVGGNTRAISEVYSTDVAARVAEQGTSSMPRRRPLLKAAIAVSVEEFGHFDGSEQ